MAKILIVDDNADSRALLVSLLKYANHQLLEAYDGSQALDLAKKEHPDLIITDIVMPTMDGYEFVYHLRNIPLLKNTKVIFYSAHYTDDEAIKLAKIFGVTHFLIKPIEPRDVLETINTFLNQPDEVFEIQLIEELNRKHQQYLTKKMYQKIEELNLALDQNTKLSMSNNELKEISARDPLTGLYNRRYLEESLVREFDRATRKNEKLAILMIDIDFFKKINDQFGHIAGDVVLQVLAQCLEGNIRKGDIVCRYGGEEFVVILLDISKKTAMSRAEILRKTIESLDNKYPKFIPQKITVSIGVSLFPQHGRDVENLIKKSDEALYLAKNNGRNQVMLSQEGGHE